MMKGENGRLKERKRERWRIKGERGGNGRLREREIWRIKGDATG